MLETEKIMVERRESQRLFIRESLNFAVFCEPGGLVSGFDEQRSLCFAHIAKCQNQILRCTPFNFVAID